MEFYSESLKYCSAVFNIGWKISMGDAGVIAKKFLSFHNFPRELVGSRDPAHQAGRY
jgi:hypothetical protein